MAGLLTQSTVWGFLERLGRYESRSRRNSTADTVPVPEGINWLIWRPIVERIAGLEEINTHYDLVDLLSAHEALDVRDEAERRAQKAATEGLKT